MKFFSIFLFSCIITVTSLAQQITTANVGTATPVCAGIPFSVAFTSSGFAAAGLTFTAQLSDASGSFTASVVIGTGTATPILATIPANQAGGNGYKVRVITTTTGLTYNTSSAFTIYKPATATLSGGGTINVGDSATLSVDFTGNAPWGFTIANGFSGTTNNDPQLGYVKPMVTTNYQLQSVSNICGGGTVAGSATVRVIPKITTGALLPSYCLGALVNVPFTLVGSFSSTPTYSVQLSNSQGSFASPTIIGTGSSSPIAVQMPNSITATSGYLVRVVSSLEATSTNSNAFSIKPKPTLVLSGSTTIDIGQSASLVLTFTGDSPWTYTLPNGLTATASTSPSSLSVSPTATTTYTIQSVSNACGTGTVSGTTTVTVLPRISAAEAMIGAVCPGAKISVPFVVTGTFDAANPTFTAQLSDANGSFTNPMVLGTGSISPLSVSLPAVLAASSGYRVRVIANANASVVATNTFVVNPLPSATVAGSSTINYGESVNFSINFSGNSPWTYQLSDNVETTATQSPVTITVKPDQTTTYALKLVKNICGNGTTNGSAIITVVPRLATEVLSENICQGTKFDVKFGIGGVLPTNTTYQAELSDSTGAFAKPTVIGTGTTSPISATIPTTLMAGNNATYKIRVINTANAQALVTPSSSFAIRKIPVATITGGNSLLKSGDIASVVIQFGGTPPWTYELSDGQKATTSISPAIITVSPLYETTYTLKSVSNACGQGVVSGQAVVKVVITNIDYKTEDNWVVAPNPAHDWVGVMASNNTPMPVEAWRIVSSSGRVIDQQKQATIDIRSLEAGLYYLQIKIKGRWTTHKLIKTNR